MTRTLEVTDNGHRAILKFRNETFERGIDEASLESWYEVVVRLDLGNPKEGFFASFGFFLGEYVKDSSGALSLNGNSASEQIMAT